MVPIALVYLLKASQECFNLGRVLFLETMSACPSRVIFLLGCILVLLTVPLRCNNFNLHNLIIIILANNLIILVRFFCIRSLEDRLAVLIVLCTTFYFLFFCRYREYLSFIGEASLMNKRQKTGKFGTMLMGEGRKTKNNVPIQFQNFEHPGRGSHYFQKCLEYKYLSDPNQNINGKITISTFLCSEAEPMHNGPNRGVRTN